MVDHSYKDPAGAISFVNKAQPNSRNRAMWNEFVHCSIIYYGFIRVNWKYSGYIIASFLYYATLYGSAAFII